MSRWAKHVGRTSSGAPLRRAKRRSTAALTTAAAGLSLGLAHPASAGTDTWVGNTSVNWADGTNWNPATPPASGDALLFGVAGSAGTTLTDNLMTQSTYNVAGITFNSSAAAYTINPSNAAAGGSGFTLQGAIVNSGNNLETINDRIGLTATQTITTNTGGGNITLGGVVNGTGGLTLSGSGTVTMSAANAYSGNTTVNGGTLNVTGQLYSAGGNSATITVAGGALLDVLTTGSATNNAIGDGAGATWSIAGTLKVDGSAEILTLPGNVILNNGGTIGGTSVGAGSYGTLYGGSLNGATTITANGAGNAIVTPSIGLAGTLGFSTPLAGDALSASSKLIDGNGAAGILNKTGQGTLTLSGASTYSGNTIVTAGTLNVSGTLYGAGIPAAGTPSIIIASGAKLGVETTTNNAIGYGSASTWNVSGSLSVDGAGVVLTLPGNVILNNGSIVSTQTTGNAGFGTLYGGLANGNGYNTPVTANGTTNTISVPTFGMAGVQTFNTPSGTDVLTVSSKLMDGNGITGVLNKAGQGTVKVTAAESYTGNTNVSAGTLVVASTLYGAAATTATITVASGATLNSSSGTNNAIGMGSGATWNVSGTLTVTGAGEVLSMPGNLVLANGGTITGTTSNAAYGTLYGGSGSNYVTRLIATGAGNTISVPSFRIDGSQSFNTPSASDALLVSAPLSDRNSTANITKLGLGVLTLSGSNAYSGGTAVTAGTLLVTNTTGSATGTAGVTVAANAALGGTGTISAAVTVPANGTLFTGLTANTAGATAGTLTVGPGTSLAGSTLIDLTAPNTSDKLVISGTSGVTLGGSLTVSDPNRIPFAAGQTYAILSYGSNSTGGTTFASLTLPTLSSDLTWDTTHLYASSSSDTLSGDIIVDATTAAPEPTSLGLLACSTAGLLGRRVRRQRRRVG